MKIKYFLQLIRYKNLLLLVFVQLFFWIRFNDNFTTIINIIQFISLTSTTVFLAAAGNVINDFFDVEVDTINKPNKVLVSKVISKKKTLLLYYILNFFGITSGIFLAIINDKASYGFIFIAISILLYFYPKFLKKTALLGNFIVSFCIALSIILIYLFPSIHLISVESYIRNKNLIFIYATFAFLLNFIREIVKDIEDVNGDYSQNMQTLPILIGRKRTQSVLFYFSIIPFILIIFFTSALDQLYFSIYSLLFIVIPLGYFMYQIREVKSKKKLHQLSTLLKWIMFFGILSSILLYL